MSPTLAAVLACLAFGAGVARADAASVSEPLTIAVASNFAVPMRELANRFEVATGNRVALTPGSTGKHYAQIVHGAPFDIFFAADEERPRKLETGGWAVPGTRFTYAVGRLVLWSPLPGLVDGDGRVLERAGFRRLALANPRLAPYGRAARQALERRGLFDLVSDRLVFGENVAQAFQMVATGNAELGFVALAQLEQPGRARAGSRWPVPVALHDPIEQQAVLVRDSPAARRFLEHVRSPGSLDLIRQYGFEAPEPVLGAAAGALSASLFARPNSPDRGPHALR